MMCSAIPRSVSRRFRGTGRIFPILLASACLLSLNFTTTVEPAYAEDIKTSAETSGAKQIAEARQTFPTIGEIKRIARNETATKEFLHQSSGNLEGRMALLMNLLLLEKAHDKLSKMPGYKATFYKQERIEGSLGDMQIIDMKVRHKPFSVYMKWLVGDKGRELIYVKGKNDGNMIVHAGGWKARLLPSLKLDPKGSMALGEARHPVTDIGMLGIARKGIAFRERDLRASSGVHCRMDANYRLYNYDCYRFTIDFDDASHSPEYRKTIVFIDKKLSYPVAVLNYGWPREDIEVDPDHLDEETLIENYAYRNIYRNQKLKNIDFDKKNENYKFKW